LPQTVVVLGQGDSLITYLSHRIPPDLNHDRPGDEGTERHTLSLWWGVRHAAGTNRLGCQAPRQVGT
jgi:hypothetical protein